MGVPLILFLHRDSLRRQYRGSNSCHFPGHLRLKNPEVAKIVVAMDDQEDVAAINDPTKENNKAERSREC